MELHSNERIVWDLEICKNFDLLKKADEIIIYGAGGKGKEILFYLARTDIKVAFFCDRDKDKWGTYIESRKVLPPSAVHRTRAGVSRTVYMIICIDCPGEVLTTFEKIGLSNVRMVTYWGIKMALHLNMKNIYEKDAKEKILLEIERKRKKNRFMETGFSFIHDIISAPDDAIWIVQPGKTATSTLEIRLREKKIPFIKLHRFEYPFHIEEKSRETWEQIIRERKKTHLKVIVAVREPLARDYSAFWQVFSGGNEMELEEPFISNDFQKIYDSYQNMILKGSNYMKRTLRDSYPYIWCDEFEWLDEQIKPYFNIDVFQYPFDREKGYTIIKKGNIELLLYKVEKMESILKIISSFAGEKSLSCVNNNVSEQKWYGLAYLQFRKEVILSKLYVDHYYSGNSKMDHFYTLEEKEEFLNKWDNIQN